MKTYFVRTFGCQMNKHDSERIAGLLAAMGLVPAPDPETADVIVFNTCCVRETADDRLYGQVSSLKALKTGGRPDVLIAVGGCVGQRDGAEVLKHAPHVDVVFGTHNIHELPSLARGCRGRPACRERSGSRERGSRAISQAREHPWHAWVSITVGCDNHCAYCIVPTVRGARAQPPARGHRRRGGASRGRRRRGDHAARPERELLRARPLRRAPLRRAARMRWQQQASGGSGSPRATRRTSRTTRSPRWPGSRR